MATITRYVDGLNGNDSWDGTEPEFVSGSVGPFATIAKALTEGSSDDEVVVRIIPSMIYGTSVSFSNTHDGKHFVLVSQTHAPYMGPALIEPASGAAVTYASNFAGLSVMLDDLALVSADDRALNVGAANVNTRARNCFLRTVGSPSITGVVEVAGNAAPTREIVLEDCVIRSSGGSIRGMDVRDVALLRVVNTRIIGNGTAGAIRPRAGSDKVHRLEIDGLIIDDSEGLWAGVGVDILSADHVDIRNCDLVTGARCIVLGQTAAFRGRVEDNRLESGVSGFQALGRGEELIVRDNEVIITGDSSLSSAIHIGVDGPTNANPHGRVVVERNHAEFAGAANSHGLLIGSGCDDALVVGNRVFNADIALVVKSQGCVIANNVGGTDNQVSTHQRGILLKGAADCFVFNNTMVLSTTDAGASTGALEWETDTGPKPGGPNIIRNNVFVADGGFCLSDVSGDNDENLFDRNVYHTVGTGRVARLEATAFDDLDDARGKWATYGENSILVENDGQSVQADPMFMNPAGRDYRVRPGSPAADLDAGAGPDGVIAVLSPVMERMIGVFQHEESDESQRAVLVRMVDAGDGVTPRSGLSLVVEVLKADGNADAAMQGVWSEVSGGTYRIVLAPEDLDVPGMVRLRVSDAGHLAAVQYLSLQVARWPRQIHLAKAALVNRRTHAIDTGVNVIYDDDGTTELLTRTPSETDGVITIE